MIRRSYNMERIPDDVVRGAQVRLVIENVHEAQSEDAKHVQCQRYEKLVEEAVVAPANAVVYPRTVMVKRLRKQKTMT